MSRALLVLVLFLSLGSWASETVDLSAEVETSVQAPERKDFENFEFKANGKADLKLPYTSQALWMKFNVSNPSADQEEKIISMTSALTGYLELYQSGSHDPIQRTGSSIPLVSRPFQSRLPAFKVELKPHSTETFYIRRLSHHNLASKLLVGSLEDFLRQSADAKAALFFYLGGILCLVFYNLFIGIFSRDANYFLYAFFASSLCAVVLNTLGFWDAYVLTSFSLSHYLMAFSSVSLLASLVFVYHFLNIPQCFPESKIGFWILGASGFVTLLDGLFPLDGTQIIFGHLIDFTIMAALLFLIACGIVVRLRGSILASFFLLSWASIIVGAIGWFGMTYGLFGNSQVTSSSLMFGNMGEMLILSLGLAYKINILDREKREALSQAREKERYHRLVKVLSHDVANAMMIFSGYLRRLKRNLQGHQEMLTVQKLESVMGNMEDMLNLVRDEETFNAFRLSVSLRPVDLFEAVQDVVAFYEDRAASKNLQLQVLVPEKSMVMADKTALTNQVLSNLLANAIKFSYPDSKIIIALENHSLHYVLKIQDHGCGIPQENIQQVFFSSEIVSRPGTIKEKGTGLGSSLVKDYMKIFNGKIQVDSVHESVSKNSGTTISLEFPKLS